MEHRMLPISRGNPAAEPHHNAREVTKEKRREPGTQREGQKRRIATEIPGGEEPISRKRGGGIRKRGSITKPAGRQTTRRLVPDAK